MTSASLGSSKLLIIFQQIYLRKHQVSQINYCLSSIFTATFMPPSVCDFVSLAGFPLSTDCSGTIAGVYISF